MIKRLLILAVLVLLLAAGAGAWHITRPLALPTQPFEFSVNQGSSLTATARQLEQAGVLPDSWALPWLARLRGKSAQIKAGNYELSKSVNMLELLDLLTSGRVSQSSVSVIEGWTFEQFRAALDANPDLRHDSKTLPQREILQRIGAQESVAEGLFFPDTYYFAKGSSDLSVLKRAYQIMQQRLAESWRARASELPLRSPYEALTLASIIEKETGREQDRDLIAAVFINRLNRGMLLQTDPTVIYGLGDHFDGNLHKRDLLADTPYNTYTRSGLPPTPIALPGLASLQAALHPAQSDALYFVARGDGSSEFSGTLEQHNRAVDKYQKQR